MMKTLDVLVGIISLSLAGCAAYQMPPLTANHPASIEAAAASKPERSKTLAYTQADVPSPRPMTSTAAAQQGGHDAHHSEGGAEKTVIGEGKVIATVADTGQLVVDHGEIKGFMGAMTMGYPVEPPSQLKDLKAGDQVRFTIDVSQKRIIKVEKLN